MTTEGKLKFTAVDLLCGLGGATQGAQASDYVKVHEGLNHSEIAIETNKANHPEVSFSVRDLYDESIVFQKHDIVIAGIECTNHSNAKGGASRNADSRAMANEMMRYAKTTGCKIMILENVREFLKWGPLVKKRDEQGRVMKVKKGKDKGRPIMIPDKEQLGRYFKLWQYKMKQIFPNHEHRILNAADYGIATDRRRLFMIFTKENYKIEWPEPTHFKNPDNLFGKQKWVACEKHIDLNNHGKSIFGRKRKDGTPCPLSPKTLERIAYGIKKYGTSQFISKYYGNGNNVTDIEDPLATITTKDRHALITTDQFYVQNYHNTNSYGDTKKPIKTIVTKDEKAFITVEKLQFIDKYFSGQTNVSDTKKPLGTILTNRKHNLATVQFLQQKYTRKKPCVLSKEEPLKTITTWINTSQITVEVAQFISKHYGGNHAAEIKKPLPTITTVDHNTLVSLMIADGIYLLDIKMRWLTPRELASCQGFPSDYILKGTKQQQVKGIGNSIPPGMITALCNSIGSANKHLIQ